MTRRANKGGGRQERGIGGERGKKKEEDKYEEEMDEAKDLEELDEFGMRWSSSRIWRNK